MEKREITCLFGTILGGGNLISVADILFTIYVYFRKNELKFLKRSFILLTWNKYKWLEIEILKVTNNL